MSVDQTNTCQGTTLQGNPCKRYKTQGTAFCSSHIPETDEVAVAVPSVDPQIAELSAENAKHLETIRELKDRLEKETSYCSDGTFEKFFEFKKDITNSYSDYEKKSALSFCLPSFHPKLAADGYSVDSIGMRELRHLSTFVPENVSEMFYVSLPSSITTKMPITSVVVSEVYSPVSRQATQIKIPGSDKTYRMYVLQVRISESYNMCSYRGDIKLIPHDSESMGTYVKLAVQYFFTDVSKDRFIFRTDTNPTNYKEAIHCVLSNFFSYFYLHYQDNSKYVYPQKGSDIKHATIILVPEQ